MPQIISVNETAPTGQDPGTEGLVVIAGTIRCARRIGTQFYRANSAKFPQFSAILKTQLGNVQELRKMAMLIYRVETNRLRGGLFRWRRNVLNWRRPLPGRLPRRHDSI